MSKEVPRLLDHPLLPALGDAKNILVAGAGGGFDCFSGIPLFHALRGPGRTVHLANLSFSALEGERRTDALYKVTADLRVSRGRYFPEFFLARFLREKEMEVPIWCLARTGVRPIAEAYRALKDELKLDAVILVDGGTDSLMRGDEAGLGTPQEDIASLIAVDELALDRSFLVCLGFGVDHYHGVAHADVLRAVQDLAKAGAYLGVWSLIPGMEEAQFMSSAVEKAHEGQPHHPSIVCSSILSALEGEFGDVHRTTRTEGSRLFINPLMTMYWAFRLKGVMRRLLYANQIRNTTTYGELDSAIAQFRSQIGQQPRTSIPL